MKKLAPAWAVISRRAFTLGMGSTLAAGCLPMAPPASGGFVGAFSSLSNPFVGGHTALFLLGRPAGTGQSDGNTHLEMAEGESVWAGSAESLLMLKVQGPNITVAVSGPFDQTESVSGEEFYSGCLHQRIRSEFGESVLVDLIRALSEINTA